jgi:hypothetical protein
MLLVVVWHYKYSTRDPNKKAATDVAAFYSYTQAVPDQVLRAAAAGWSVA